MAVREIVPGVSSIGAIDWDRRLFDALIPLPEGTSYNAYLVRGSEKTALIDTVDPTKEFEYVCNLVRAGVDRVEYLVMNHAEQDHSGTIPMALELFPDARLVTSEKGKDLALRLLDVSPERIQVVADRETISLGDRTLEFIMAPWVHWPETMLTYLREDRILFSCDLFGSHLATGDLSVPEITPIGHFVKRYYAEIMMPFRTTIKGHLDKISALDIDIIAPSHGPLYKPPASVLAAYRDWVSDDVKNEVVIVYVSMHGSTEKMIHHLAGILLEKGVTVKVFNLTATDLGELSLSLVDSATIIFGTPTMLFGPHPQMVNAAYVINILRPKVRFGAIVGSFGWGGNTVDTLKGMLGKLNLEMFDPVYVRGAPDSSTLRDLEALAGKIVDKHHEIGIL
jgi:flavorubredoxin